MEPRDSYFVTSMNETKRLRFKLEDCPHCGGMGKVKVRVCRDCGGKLATPNGTLCAEHLEAHYKANGRREAIRHSA